MRRHPGTSSASGAPPGGAGEVWRLFLRLGVFGFGGPAAHVAMMEDEVVRRRRWVTREHFLDLLGATNLIPGPNSTEMAIHLGFVRAGWPGLIAGGAAFILPAMASVLAIAVAYDRYGDLPQAGWLLYGIKPVIIAIVLQALWRLGRRAAATPATAALALVVLVLALRGVNEVALLLGAALGLPVLRLAARGGATRVLGGLAGTTGGAAAVATATAPAGAATPAAVSLVSLVLIFLKIGSVLFGSGYVLLAFLRDDLVERGWMTDAQLLDAIAIGQFTPGPVLTTATFIGYLLAGVPGAILSTVAIFLPAFVLVALSNPLIPRLRGSPWTAAFLDGANAASVALMAAVTWLLARAAVVDPLTALLAVAAAGVLFWTRLNSAWLVAGGAAVGVLSALLR
jgi:chromate transporter